MSNWRYLRPALQPLRGSTRYAIFGLACIAIAGCADGHDADTVRERNGPFRGLAGFQGDEVKVFTDPLTGCEYLVRDSYKRGGMTARLGSNGMPLCPEQPQGE